MATTTYEELLESELQEGETVIAQEKGDQWEYFLNIIGMQNQGRYFFTEKRIIFYYCLSKHFEVNYSDIEAVELCNVGPLIRFVPTGIKLTTKDGKSYYMSVMKRKEYQELIEKQMKAV
ncbi:MAG: PH domain-containing protein [Lachnospiraceae bacterium]|nr:PH domain-containing protein [Lachnospiraceae bacterium]MBQ7777009.1 PH domain-containing protein [Lachnospiraceae bacterium]